MHVATKDLRREIRESRGTAVQQLHQEPSCYQREALAQGERQIEERRGGRGREEICPVLSCVDRCVGERGNKFGEQHLTDSATTSHAARHTRTTAAEAAATAAVMLKRDEASMHPWPCIQVHFSSRLLALLILHSHSLTHSHTHSKDKHAQESSSSSSSSLLRLSFFSPFFHPPSLHLLSPSLPSSQRMT